MNVRRDRVAVVCGLLLSLSGCASPFERSSDRAPEEVSKPHAVQAAWKWQRIVFEYRPGNVHYTCFALQEKLKTILLTLGARQDLSIRPHPCDLSARVARFEIEMRSPIEVTPQNSPASLSAREELIDRVQRLENRTAAPRMFHAAWRPVSFRSDRRLSLDNADCQLVKQLRDGVFPFLSLRIAEELRCSPLAVASGRLQLSVYVLTAVEVQDAVLSGRGEREAGGVAGWLPTAEQSFTR
jgi:hypothetical protein